jgi:hypothetical protein
LGHDRWSDPRPITVVIIEHHTACGVVSGQVRSLLRTQ